MSAGSQGKTLSKAIEVIEALSANRSPMSLADISKATDINKNAVLRIVNTLVLHKWLRKIGEHYEPDHGLAAIWSRYKANVEFELSRLDTENTELEVE